MSAPAINVQDNLEKFFEQNGVKHTAQREAIVREFLNTKEHISIDELLRRQRHS